MIKLILQGRPISTNHLYRSAVGKNTGKPFTYMTDEGKNAKLAWQLEARVQLHKQRGDMFRGTELYVAVAFYFENRARRDIDNYFKALLDCLTGIVWEDDKQIMRLRVEKRYVEKGELPRTELTVEEIGL